jgi:hypothetical protein
MTIFRCACVACVGGVLVFGQTAHLAREAGAVPCFIEQPCERALPLADLPEPDYPKSPPSAGAGATIDHSVTVTGTFTTITPGTARLALTGWPPEVRITLTGERM